MKRGQDGEDATVIMMIPRRRQTDRFPDGRTGEIVVGTL